MHGNHYFFSIKSIANQLCITTGNVTVWYNSHLLIVQVLSFYSTISIGLYLIDTHTHTHTYIHTHNRK
jgi:hypothetical protein